MCARSWSFIGTGSVPSRRAAWSCATSCRYTGFARDPQCLRDVAELVLAQRTQLLGDDLLGVRRYRLADLFEVIHLDEEAFARVARTNAPWLDRHDRLVHALGILERDLGQPRGILERHALEATVVVDVPDQIFSGGMQPRWKHDAHVPREIFRERLLCLGADDRIELIVLVVALHEARALERLGLQLIAARRLVGEAEAIQTNATLQRLATERTDLTLLEIERGIVLQLRVDDVLQFHGG